MWPTMLPVSTLCPRYFPVVAWQEECNIPEQKWNATIKPQITQLLWKVLMKELLPLGRNGE